MTTGSTDSTASRCSALVIFGVTGDLARKKLFASLYELELLGQLDMPVIGVGRSSWSVEQLREVAATSISSRQKGQRSVDEKAKEQTLASLHYIQGSYDSAALYRAIGDKVGNHENVLCYLAVPPETFPKIIEGLGTSGIRSNVRLLIEKPFGSDRRSASALFELVMKHFDADQLFAVDHYLQKESLQNLLVLRFANKILEPLWNRRSIDAIDIVMSETAGIEGRGQFFDATGTLRDVVQNHGLQTLTALAMEPPKSSLPEHIDASRIKLLEEIEALTSSDVVFGQYIGYQAVEGVQPNSTTDTFVRATFCIDNERFAGASPPGNPSMNRSLKWWLPSRLLPIPHSSANLANPSPITSPSPWPRLNQWSSASRLEVTRSL
jgi:glucose-6-phosphate 1-dehydrogenase